MSKQEHYEGKCKLFPYVGTISKELPVFYNPVMKLNRDISILVCLWYFYKQLQATDTLKFCFPLAGSGIRPVRLTYYFKQLQLLSDQLQFHVNDGNPKSAHELQDMLALNQLPTNHIHQTQLEANKALRNHAWHYIEIDPFGSPHTFLDSALAQIKHKGLLSVTATDTGTLGGIFPKTALRRYHIQTRRTWWHQELGIRTLFTFIQSLAARYDKHIIPLLSFTHQHFVKIICIVNDGAQKATQHVQQQEYLKLNTTTQRISPSHSTQETIGKLYTGPLHDIQCLKEILEIFTSTPALDDCKSSIKLLTQLSQEVNTVGFYHIPYLCRALKISSIPTYQSILDHLPSGSRTHASPYGIKTQHHTSLHNFLMKLK